MTSDLHKAVLRVVNTIIIAGVPQGSTLRDAADTLTNTHPTEGGKADFMLYAFYYCRGQSMDLHRSKIERDAYKSIAETCHAEIKGLML